MMRYVNSAAYQFVALTDLTNWQSIFRALAEASTLSGSVLISPEGINMMLFGETAAMQIFKNEIASYTEFANLHWKDQYTNNPDKPFCHLFIKIRKEIIPLGIQAINPITRKANYVFPSTLKQWLDDKKNIIILDTRNDYEIQMGTFKQAQPLGIKHFRLLPQAVKKLDVRLKKETVVTVCTGGIRCEKAALLLEQEGFNTVYQLHGGILDYLKYDTENQHYEGGCYVFDKRHCIFAADIAKER